jgi:uncharacterized coiled-coil protein SlyX
MLRKLIPLLLLAPSLRAQTPYVPTCLTAAQQAAIAANGAALATNVGIDLTDPLMRLADSQCTALATTVGALADISKLKTNVASDESTIALQGQGALTLNAAVAALQQQVVTLQTQVATLQAQVSALTPPPPVPTPAVIVVQAEAYATLTGGPTTLPVTCARGSGTALCNPVPGETLTYSIQAHAAGNYLFTMSASATAGGTISISLNGGAPQIVTTPTTGSPNTFVTVTGPVVPLVSGANTLTLVFNSAQQDPDFFTFTQQ